MRLGINYREKKKKTTTVKNTNTWRLKSMPLNNQGSLKKSKRKWKTANLETNGYENKTIHNLWDMTKAVLRGKFIAIQSYLRKQEKLQINNLTLHLKQLEKEQTKAKVRRKESIRIRAEISETETKKKPANINETKIQSLRKETKLIKPLGRHIKKGKGLKSIQLEIKSRSYNGHHRNTKDHRGYYKQLYANKVDNLEEMDKFLEKYNCPRMNQDEMKNINQS